ncbi:hypothetical protein ACTXT7_015789 [Hymenolepis weldensis]
MDKLASRRSRSMTQKQVWPKGNVSFDFSDFKKEMLDVCGISKSLETEYIRSLHKQIYLFQLENKYLRKELENAASALPKPKQVERKKKKDKSVDVDMTNDERNLLVNELIRKCDEIQPRLVGEISLMKEQIDIFTQDILKLKDEKEAILKENKQKDEVIEELNKNANAWRNQLLDYEEKFGACKQALTSEIRRRKILERKLEEPNTNIPKINEIHSQAKFGGGRQATPIY